MSVLADEIYGRIVYEGEHVSIASLPGHGRAHDRPRRLLEDLRDDRLAAGLRDRADRRSCRSTAGSSSTRSACTPTFAQIAAVEALTGPQDAVDAMVEEFRAPTRPHRRRPQRDPRASAAAPPTGAFYAFPDICGDGPDRAGVRRPAAQRGRGLRAGRDRVRAAWGRTTSGSATPTRARTSTEALAADPRVRRAQPCLSTAPAARRRATGRASSSRGASPTRGSTRSRAACDADLWDGRAAAAARRAAAPRRRGGRRADAADRPGRRRVPRRRRAAAARSSSTTRSASTTSTSPACTRARRSRSATRRAS